MAALSSVLEQDRGQDLMQIEVIDDHSTDCDVSRIVAELGKGRVTLFRQEKNVGSLRNFETCLNRAQGQYVHILHGDDLVLPGFYDEIEGLFHDYPDAGAAFTGFFHIDEAGNELYPNDTLSHERGPIENWQSIITQSQKIQPPAIVVKRSVYEQLGGFFGMHYGEDWEMWVRISLHFPVVHSPLHLAHYRLHQNNITSRSFRSGQNIKDVATAINIVQGYLPPDKGKRRANLAKRNFSVYFARTSDLVYHFYGDPSQALLQARSAFSMHRNSVTFYFVFKIYLKKLIRYKFSLLPHQEPPGKQSN